jgi:NADH-quinone oxidoreductase subunit J
MSIVGYLLLSVIVLIGAILAIRAKNLIVAASVLGLGSAALAMLLFMLDAPYAAGFELSVGAGLVSVLFIVAISLTASMRIAERLEQNGELEVGSKE